MQIPRSVAFFLLASVAIRLSSSASAWREDPFDYIRTAHEQGRTLWFNPGFQAPVLLITWFLDTNGTAMHCEVDAKGKCLQFRYAHNWAYQNSRTSEVSAPQIQRLIKNLPVAPPLPPRERCLLVTTREHEKVTTRAYDRADIPDPVRRLVDATGSYCIQWIPEIRETASIEGHKDMIYDLDVSGNGKRFATGSRDNTVKLWDSRSRREILTITPDHQAYVNSVALSPDGKVVAAVSLSTLYFFDAGTGILKAKIRPDTSHYKWSHFDRVRFSPDGKRFATSGNEVALWNAEARKVITYISGGCGPICFSPGGKLLASFGTNKSVMVWDTKTGAQVAEFESVSPYSLAVSPNGKSLVVGTGSMRDPFQLFDLTSKAPRSAFPQRFEHYVESPVSFGWSPNGRLVATGTQNGLIVLHDALTLKPLALLTGHRGNIPALRFLPDNRTLISVAWDHTIKFWDVGAVVVSTKSRNTNKTGWTDIGIANDAAGKDNIPSELVGEWADEHTTFQNGQVGSGCALYFNTNGAAASVSGPAVIGFKFYATYDATNYVLTLRRNPEPSIGITQSVCFSYIYNPKARTLSSTNSVLLLRRHQDHVSYAQIEASK